MKYYIFFEGEDESWAEYDENQLGESNGFGTFYVNRGWERLKKLLDEKEDNEELSEIDIYDEQGGEYTVDEFVNKIDEFDDIRTF